MTNVCIRVVYKVKGTVAAKICIQNIYKSLPKCGIQFVYINSNLQKVYELCIQFVYRINAECMYK